MPRTKSEAKNNRVINGLVLISEAFRKADIEEENVLEACYTIDFVHYFDQIKDWRNQDMVKYKLQNLLLMALLVILSRGINSFYGIATYVRLDKEKYEKYGLIEDGMCPSHDTFRRVFELLDSKAIFEQTIDRLYDFLSLLEKELLGQTTHKQIMVDGKEVRGSGRSLNSNNPKRNVQILNIYDNSLQTCIHSEAIDEKTNEIPVAQAYQKQMSLKNVVVTADALHCQTETAKVVAQKRGIYVLTVKENQPSLLQEIHTRIDKNPKKVITVIRGKRVFELYHLPKNYATDGFIGMKTFVRMKSSAHSKRKADMRCFISNSADEELILEAIENRWDIENGFHKEKDLFLGEDRFRSTYRNTVLNLAVLNNLALQLVKIYQAISSITFYEAKVYMQLHPIEGLQKIAAVVDNTEVIDQVRSELKKIKKLETVFSE